MKIISSTNSNNADYNGDMDYLVIEISSELAQNYLKFRDEIERFKEKYGEHNVLCIEIWDGFDAFEYTDELDEVLDEIDTYWFVPDSFDVPDEHIQRTDLHTCRVYDNGLTFRCYERHGNTAVDSPRIRWEHIEQIAEGKKELEKIEETA